MNDWVDTLKAARISMRQLETMSDEPDQTTPLQLRLLGDLFRIANQFDATKILFNVQIAAIGLYFILQGKRSTDLVRNSHDTFNDSQDVMVVSPCLSIRPERGWQPVSIYYY